jgi:hypothetical protein
MERSGYRGCDQDVLKARGAPVAAVGLAFIFRKEVRFCILTLQSVAR